MFSIAQCIATHAMLHKQADRLADRLNALSATPHGLAQGYRHWG
jgi:hypothetical protein